MHKVEVFGLLVHFCTLARGLHKVSEVMELHGVFYQHIIHRNAVYSFYLQNGILKMIEVILVTIL